MDSAIINGLLEKLEKLDKKIQQLENKRINQMDITPDSVKMRSIGEGVRYIRDGIDTSKPTVGEKPLQGAAVYFDYTNNKLWIWNRKTNLWKSVILT